MFKKFFKTVAGKLFNAGKKNSLPKAETPKFEEPPEIQKTKKEKPKRKRWHFTERLIKESGWKGPKKKIPKSKRTPPTMMPPFNPERRKHGEGIFSPTSRFIHKPWPFKKVEQG
jgi:hypothetical protein